MSKQRNESDRYWAKIIGQALVTLPGASNALLRVQLFDTLEEFFDGSSCWKEEIKFNVIPGTLDYQLAPLSGRILRLSDVLDQNSVPQQAIMPIPGQVKFLYPYDNIQPMTAVTVKTVTDPLSCFPPHIPEWMLPVHGLGILHGLIGSMMLQPGQSYSNPGLANFHLRKYEDAISHACTVMSQTNKMGVQSWMFPQAFRVGGQKGGVSTFNVLPTLR
jgi:hypothetical protein